MDLREFNACLRAYNKKTREDASESIANAWQTANMTGAAFGGKLKALKHYLKNVEKSQENEKKDEKSEPNISKEEFNELLKNAKRVTL